MSNNLEINDSAPKCPEPAGQLSQECWTFDKGSSLKLPGSNKDSVLDFGKNDIYSSGDFKFPKGYDIDPGFAPKSGDHHIKVGGEDIVIPAGKDMDPGFAPKAGDRHIKVGNEDIVLPAGYDIDPGFNPGGKDNQAGRGDKGSLLPSAAHGTQPDRLDPKLIDAAKHLSK